MSTPIEFQIIEQDGRPLFAVVPYDAFITLLEVQDDRSIYIPLEVVRMTTVDGMSLLQAWRNHKGLSLVEVAKKAGISRENCPSGCCRTNVCHRCGKRLSPAKCLNRTTSWGGFGRNDTNIFGGSTISNILMIMARKISPCILWFVKRSGMRSTKKVVIL